MTRAERGQQFVEKEQRIAKEYAAGSYSGDVYHNGKPAPRESAKDTTIALMDELAELDKARVLGIK